MMAHRLMIVFAAIGSVSVTACPFCDYGAQDTATFIVLLFGLFILGMASIFFIFSLKGGWKDSAAVDKRVLEVEKGNPRE